MGVVVVSPHRVEVRMGCSCRVLVGFILTGSTTTTHAYTPFQLHTTRIRIVAIIAWEWI
jgi:hypothetical protein